MIVCNIFYFLPYRSYLCWAFVICRLSGACEVVFIPPSADVCLGYQIAMCLQMG